MTVYVQSDVSATVAVGSVMVSPYNQEKLMDFTNAIEKVAGVSFAAKIPGDVDGPLVWSGADCTDPESYAWHLSASNITEIETALASFKDLGLDGDAVSRHNFPLPTLSQRLEECAKEIHQGRGFFVFRGLDASKYTIEDSVTIYLGIANYIGDLRGFQDRKGNVLSHVTNSKLWKVPEEQRHGIHSSTALPFHNDMGCDILALQVRDIAKNGGDTYISSTGRVLNSLLLDEPDVVQALFTPNWPVQVSGRKAQYYLAPAFTTHNGRLMTSLDPNRFGPHPSSTNSSIPHLTKLQEHALQVVSTVAQKSELRLKLETGDLLFLNNWALLHRRDAYQDGTESNRHLVRLWLRNTQLGWPVPASMLPPWLASYGEKKKISARLYPLMPMPDYVAPKYSAGSAAFVVEDSDESDSD